MKTLSDSITAIPRVPLGRESTLKLMKLQPGGGKADKFFVAGSFSQSPGVFLRYQLLVGYTRSGPVQGQGSATLQGVLVTFLLSAFHVLNCFSLQRMKNKINMSDFCPSLL